jgi:bacteriocin biosynthesis cyclodehydratase domain-containing protein
MHRVPSRPCLALPFTVLSGPGRVRLIAGEDFRYTLEAPGLEQWLPALLARSDGRSTLDELLTTLPPDGRTAAREVLARLYGERVLIDGSAPDAHRPAAFCVVLEGDDLGFATSSPYSSDNASPVVKVLTQDRLDYEAAVRFNDQCLRGTAPWLWVSTGPLNRGYVSPVFLPDAGPCLACLLRHFQRLSPAPELYDDLQDHARRGRPVQPVPFPPHGKAMLRHLLQWKVELLQEPEPSAALFRLHVLEVASLDVSSHRVFCDPECPACSGRR